MIYIATILNNQFIKIGFTSDEDVRNRIASLQTGNPFKIDVLFTIKGSINQEQELHKALYKAFTRIRVPMPPNEWYPGKNFFMQQFLENLVFGFDFGIAFLDKYDQNVRQPSKKRGELKVNYKWPNKADIPEMKIKKNFHKIKLANIN